MIATMEMSTIPRASRRSNSPPAEEDTHVGERIWWKIDRHILPAAVLLYLFSWLDRTNIGNARVAGLQDDLRLTPTQYSMALTVTFIPYILVELPSNLVLKAIGPERLLPGLLLCWGVVTTLQGLVNNYAGFLACRFFIGLFEGGLLPGLAVYLSWFYPRELLQFRISALFSAVSLSGAFSGLLAFAISRMGGIGGRPAWSWIFILEGSLTVVFGVLSFWMLPASPADAQFLSPEEKIYVLTRLRETDAIDHVESDESFSWREVGETFKLPHIWLLLIIAFFNGVFTFSVGYFTPSIVQSFGFPPILTQLMTVPPFAAAFVVSMTAAIFSDKYNARGLTIILSSLCAIAGFSVFLGSTKKWVLYGSLFLLIGGGSCTGPTILTWQTNNTFPHIRRATGVAMLSVMVNSGGILSTWLLGSLSSPPKYTKAMLVMLVLWCLTILPVGLNIAYLRNQNERKRRIREMTGKENEPAGLGDRSAWFKYIL